MGLFDNSYGVLLNISPCPQEAYKMAFLALVLALSVMAFFVVPEETDDLSNYFIQLSSLRKGDFNTLRRMIENGNENWDSLPVCGLYFFYKPLFGERDVACGYDIFSLRKYVLGAVDGGKEIRG